MNTELISECKTNLQHRVVELTEEINDSQLTLLESKAAHEEWCDGLRLNPAFMMTKLADRLLADARRYMAQQEMDRYLETINADLMHCEKKYVVTDTKQLVSPSGFHPDTKVFRQTTIAIHTDSLDNLPASNRRLYAHKVN